MYSSGVDPYHLDADPDPWSASWKNKPYFGKRKKNKNSLTYFPHDNYYAPIIYYALYGLFIYVH